MTRSVRPTTAADVRSVLELFQQTGLHPNVEPQDLQWKYWQPRADWPGPRSFVLADDEAVIAHGAVIPGWCSWETRRIRVIHLVDWAARPGAAGAGVALMKQVGQGAQALLAIGGSAATQQVLPHIGFRPVGAVTRYVRTLFPMRLLRGRGSPAWRRWARFARGVAWARSAPSGRRAGWRARRVGGEDIRNTTPMFPRPVGGMAVLERSVELFQYMLSCPVVPMELFALEKSGGVRGYFLLASAPGQVRIADCWIDSNDPAEWREMILCALEQAKHDPQAADIVAWANDRLLAEALAACGFLAREQIPIQLRPADAGSMPPVPLRVQMVDSDAAFLHEGWNGYRE